MTAPHQPAWVLLSASADRRPCEPDPSDQHPILEDIALIEARRINRLRPQSLVQQAPTWTTPHKHPRFAVLITGELRCLNRSGQLFRALKKRADLFVVTTAEFRDRALQLTSPERTLIVEDHPLETKRDQAVPVNAMKQWHKLELAWRLLRKEENQRGATYRYVIKLRSDYHIVHPKAVLKSVRRACRHPDSGLVGASDKVFGGRRQSMQMLEGFFDAIPGWFDQREKDYWPINLKQVLASDDSVKWYGMNWPAELIGRPPTPSLWRRKLEKIDPSLVQALGNRRNQGPEHFHRLLRGHPRFASEICFSRFLNFCGIPFRDCKGLRGFLYSDRLMQP
ncbi:hypothetical protein [Synechococcus sp. MU1617]|uniref:hypothetical protein n=1 Tax=Synechococcus sp. MU1617 TaxID=2508346 RepID=UPI001CF88CFA|nr:hypothetical protein [Synechococcus sp. MU1617]MCB4389378.1 hypothetical protein [Synechococcus sp. MU1617]